MSSFTEPEISLDQLSTHSSLSSLWIAVHGNVYDLTSFVSDHPGGIEALHSVGGTDGTEAYESAGHSELNTKKLQQFLIGKLQGAHPSLSVSFSASVIMTKGKIKNTASSPKSSKVLFRLGMIEYVLALVCLVWLHHIFLAPVFEAAGENKEERDGGSSVGVSAVSAFAIGTTVASLVGLAITIGMWGIPICSNWRRRFSERFHGCCTSGCYIFIISRITRQMDVKKQ
ncbi:unnamed protein product [Periconia digitata]|uniref:Cytochrome b5 heme-binding domain-containing protein n=1 Tax=Periconia digitata TaxID=1303443 RepID=A0A9W4UNT9_9PLEO|nr:unnamed protein product [Periconia digitata]